MKLVAVTENGQTKILPMAEPNWEQLWGTGPYWGKSEVTVLHAPKQSQIGVAKEVPVYVKVNQGTISSSEALIITVVVALLGAFGGQLLAHDRATKRDEEERYVDAATAVFAAAATINGAIGQFGWWTQANELEKAVRAFDDLVAASDVFDGAAITFDLRTETPTDPILLAVEGAQARLIDVLSLGRSTLRPPKFLDELDRLQGEFVQAINNAVVESRKLRFGRAPGKRGSLEPRAALTPSKPERSAST